MEIKELNVLDIFDIPNILERNYWLVRTNGGDYFSDFITHDYIAIGWDYLSISYFSTMKEKALRELIKLNERSNPTKDFEEQEDDFTGSDGTITSIYNKIKRFTIEFNIGDVVLIPDKNSEKIAMGIVTSDPYENQNYIKEYLDKDPDSEITLCPYYKRRKIKWLNICDRKNADIYLLKAFSSHHAISDINEYAPYINRNIHSIYSINNGNEVHATLKAGGADSISIKELKDLIDLVYEQLNSVSEQLDIRYNADDIKVKLNIHSPGLLEIISCSALAGIGLSMLIFSLNHLINGGETKFDYFYDEKGKARFHLESKSKGIKGRELEEKRIDNKHELDLKQVELQSSANIKALAEKIYLEIPNIQLNEEIEDSMDDSIKH